MFGGYIICREGVCGGGCESVCLNSCMLEYVTVCGVHLFTCKLMHWGLQGCLCMC